MSSHGITPEQLRAVNLPRRRAINRFMEGLAMLAALIAVAILGIVIWSVAKRGAGALDLNLLTKNPVPFAFGPVKQGLANAFVGSFVLAWLSNDEWRALLEQSGFR